MINPVNQNISTTFVKGIRVLKAFDDANTHLALADLATRTQLDRASVRRLVLTLVDLGYVRQTGRYFALTPKILALAGSFFQGNAVGKEIQPVLNRYSEVLGGPTSLALRDETSAVYVCQSAPRAQPVTFGFTVGSRLSLAYSAIGRMILAGENPDWTAEYLKTCEVFAYTPKSLADRTEIAATVNISRTNGFAVVVDEFEIGVTGLAVPIGREGALMAVVGTSFPSADVSQESTRTSIIQLLQALARELTYTRMFSQS